MTLEGDFRVATEQQILEELDAVPDESPPDLVRAIIRDHPEVAAGQVRQTVWSLIARGVVEFTPAGRLRRPEEADR
jgi:hypothetical protein